MGIYIQGIGAISPQKTFSETFFMEEYVPFAGNRLKCIDPEYASCIEPRMMRRMSRIMKMGITSALMALQDAGIKIPDAIITGTALGCLEDTAVFLKNLILNKEEMLSPTPFIYSTHNTVSSLIALLLGSHGYNSTYVHCDTSFESALMDAFMLLEEGSTDTCLVGGMDEITDVSFNVCNRLGHYKPANGITSENLYTQNTKGSVAGEGAAFFALSGQLSPDSRAQIRDIRSFSFLQQEQVAAGIRNMLDANGIPKPDLVLSGHNGDNENDKEYDFILEQLEMQDNFIRYKHLCGEYPTASAFGLYFAVQILRNGFVPQFIAEYSGKKNIKSILLYNQSFNRHASAILLTSC